MKKIVILDGYTENPGDLSWEPFKKFGSLTVYQRSNQEQVIQRIGDASIVLPNKVSITKEVIDACPNIEYIGELATGYNNIDIDYAKKHNITVTNVPSYGSEIVGQFAIALLLEICHHIGHHDQTVKQGRWTNCRDFCYWDYPLIELAGKTMGIIGFGRIGQVSANISKALGMNVIYYDHHQTKQKDSLAQYVPLEKLYNSADVISLHCPLTSENKNMINKDSIAKMKDGVIIINNSRGGLINDIDLANALNSGKVYGAGLDTISIEPIQENNPLLTAKNCIITPHISWAAKESRQRLMDIAINNLDNYLQGHPINVVNN